MTHLSILAQGDSILTADIAAIPRPICAVNTAVAYAPDLVDIWCFQDEADKMDRLAGQYVRGRELTVWTTTCGLRDDDKPPWWGAAQFTRMDQAVTQFAGERWAYEDIQIPRTVIELSCLGWTARWSMPTVHAAVMHALRSGYKTIEVWCADMMGKNAAYYGQDERPEDYYPVRWVHERETLAWCMKAARGYVATVRRRGHRTCSERPVVNWNASERIFVEKQARLRKEA